MGSFHTGEGSQSFLIRQYHECIVLQCLRRLGQASKADLARAVDLTNSAIGQIVRSLEARGLIMTTGKRRGERGQPATLLQLNPAGAYGIGVHIDRGRIETALTDLGGRIIAGKARDIDLSAPDTALDLIGNDIDEIVGGCDPQIRDRIAGVGLARPFDLDCWLNQLFLVSPPAPGPWDKTDVAGALTRRTGFATFEENDTAAAVIAELFHGHGQDINNFLYLFIGPCVSGGLVLDGTYMRGQTGNAADIAVMPVGPSKLASAPVEGRQILLARASLNTLIRHLHHAGSDVPSLGDLTAAITQAPAAAGEWFDDCVDALVGPILSACALLDLSVVVIDSNLDRRILENAIMTPLEEALAAHVAEAQWPPRLLTGGFGSGAGALGAASLPLLPHFGPGAGLPAWAAYAGKGGLDHAAVS